jgi:hypothetical protein
VAVPTEIITPELVLVDPELGARARAAMPDVPAASLRALTPQASGTGDTTTPVAGPRNRPYPVWARVTAALWLLVLGILIGGAAIPHAQDRPRLIPAQDEPSPTVCTTPQTPAQPQLPRGDRLGGF